MLCSASQNLVSTGHNEKTTDQFLGEFEKTCCSVSIVDDFGDVFEPSRFMESNRQSLSFAVTIANLRPALAASDREPTGGAGDVDEKP